MRILNRRFLQLLPATITLLPICVKSSCECGYRIRSSGDFYTSLLINNFSTYPAATNLNLHSANFSRDWTVQSWSVPASTVNPEGRTNYEENVWLDGSGLVLRQQGYNNASSGDGGSSNVSVAAIVSKRSDFLHASARATFDVDAGEGQNRGSVAGFFWYNNDVNEIDIEVLTKETNDTTIHYTTHPSILPDGSINPKASAAVPLKTPWTMFQEYRFDWIPNNITFYQSDRAVHSTTTNVPSVAGTLQLNLWATGSEWSGPPSANNVTMKVSQIVIFFNSSMGDNGAEGMARLAACQKIGGPSVEGAVCWDDAPGVLTTKKASSGTVSFSVSGGFWGTFATVMGLVFGMLII